MKPNVIKIIKTDFLSMLALIAPTVVFLLMLEDRYVGGLGRFLSRGHSSAGEAHEFFFMALLILLVSLIPFLLFRIYSFYRWFGHSQLVVGLVTHVPWTKDRGTLKYIYEFNGQEYTARNFVHRSRDVRAISPNQEVEIVVCIEKPSKAFIKQLYV